MEVEGLREGNGEQYAHYTELGRISFIYDVHLKCSDYREDRKMFGKEVVKLK
jgi:hypothetical protein